MNQTRGSQVAAAVVLCIATLFGPPAASQVDHRHLHGRLVWAGSGRAVVGASVRVAGTNLEGSTDHRGRWRFELPRGDYELRFAFVHEGRPHRVRLVNQRVPQYKPAVAYAVPADTDSERFRETSIGWGVPAPKPANVEETGRATSAFPVSTDSAPPGQLTMTLPADEWPATIRVARRSDPESGCWDNPVVAIEELPFSTYVRGVLPPEIGVFRDLPNASEIFRAFAVAAASYGLWFRLRYSDEERRHVAAPLPPDGLSWFHIDDTACNQRYSDTRLPIADKAVDTVDGQILVHESDSRRIDKYEYAASCGQLGTRPEHQSEIVADRQFGGVCIGGWCGHADCAGHEDHPDRSGPDTCLVRGICQWGAASMAAHGYDYRQILEHYQPNLRLLDPGPRDPRHVDLTGFVYDDPEDIPGSGIGGATVRLGDLRQTRTGADGRFRFSQLPWPDRPRRLTAAHPDYEQISSKIPWKDGPVTWMSLHLEQFEADPTPDVSLADVDPAAPKESTEAACRVGPGPTVLLGLVGWIGRRRRLNSSTTKRADYPPC